MKRKILVNEVGKVTKTKKQAAVFIEIIFSIIKKTLKKGDAVFISGFGTFSAAKRKARKGRNPKTGEAIKIGARMVPRFKPAKALKDAVK